MNKYIYSGLICFSLLLFISFCTSCRNAEFEEKNFKAIFDDHDVDGCFILFDVNSNKTIKYNSSKCSKEFLPASTFKIPHSLIAMELGIIPDTSFTLKWDGKHRAIDAWNRDHNLKSAVKYSVVWFYEEIGKKVGDRRMSEWLTNIEYGNKDVTGKYPYWISGNLRITPDQQMEFIKKFYFENLPFKKENIRTLKDILILEKSDNYKLTGKTGWADLDGENVGWIVGYLEEKNNTYLFVTNITVRNNPPQNFASLRFEITKKIFSKLNLMQN